MDAVAGHVEGNASTKRRRTDWRQEPDFLDATASISVSTFGARRVPELTNLYLHTRRLAAQDGHFVDKDLIHERKNLLSGGGKRSSRHLRRRTTAVKSKVHRHRYPFRNGTIIAENDKSTTQPIYKGATRKSQRKKQNFLEEQRLTWLHSNENEADDNNSGAPQKPSWLVTHLWHSKRFHLLSPPNKGNTINEEDDSSFGNWTGIPLVHTNRGPRAALRLSQNKDRNDNDGISSVMIRDVTWDVQPLTVECCEPSSAKKDSSLEKSSQFLLQQLGTICPGLLELLQPTNRKRLSEFLAGKISIEETAYQVNSFPSGAIGPVMCRMLTLDSHNINVAIEFRIPPSIRIRILTLLENLSNGLSSKSPFRLRASSTMGITQVPRICFRLYGVESGNALQKVLKLNESQKNQFLSSSSYSDGSILRMKKVGLAGPKWASDEHTSDSQRSTTTHDTSCDDPHRSTDDITLIYREPRSLDCSANRAMVGWEVHSTDATFAKALWLALVTLDDSSMHYSFWKSKEPPPKRGIRGCCAIGLVEESHMRLECEPPLPLFPRDYVDTHESQRYWGTSDLPLSSWKRIRQLCEAGWGRLPIHREKHLEKLANVDFGELVENGKDEGARANIVVVRGGFGQPFVDAIRGSCGNYTPKDANAINLQVPSTEENENNQSKKKRRRNRRSARPKNQTIHSPPLSKASRTALSNYCRQLSSSLSLPAVLLVHIRVEGTGSICPGMAIRCANISSAAEGILGRITTGSFSTSRGVCHGIGVVGAIRLLDYIESTTALEHDNDSDDTSRLNRCTKGYGRIVRLANGSQSLQLLVQVGKILKRSGNEEGDSIFVGCDANLSALI